MRACPLLLCVLGGCFLRGSEFDEVPLDGAEVIVGTSHDDLWGFAKTLLHYDGSDARTVPIPEPYADVFPLAVGASTEEYWVAGLLNAGPSVRTAGTSACGASAPTAR